MINNIKMKYLNKAENIKQLNKSNEFQGLKENMQTGIINTTNMNLLTILDNNLKEVQQLAKEHNE